MENIKYKFTQSFKKISELVQNLKWANKRKYEKLKLFDYKEQYDAGKSVDPENKADGQYAYNITFRYVCGTFIAVEKQKALHILSVCL